MTDKTDQKNMKEVNRVVAWIHRHSISIYALCLSTLLTMIALAPEIFIDVPPGHVGVLWERFGDGTKTDTVYGEGLNVVLPWNRLELYDVRLTTDTRVYDALSANGLQMGVTVAVRYRINPPAAGYVQKLAGHRVGEVLVYPKIANLVYEFVSQHDPEEFYSFFRRDIQNFLINAATLAFDTPPANLIEGKDTLDIPLIRVEEVMVSGISLPALVKQAIERKIEQQQIMQEYDFRLAREKKESDRKRIEAAGVRDFQDTVARSITPEYLRLRGIEATKAFANSPNAKTIIIGGSDGLPVILNTGNDDLSRSAPVTGALAAPVGPSPQIGEEATGLPGATETPDGAAPFPDPYARPTSPAEESTLRPPAIAPAQPLPPVTPIPADREPTTVDPQVPPEGTAPPAQ